MKSTHIIATVRPYALSIAWIQTFVALVGSLFFSEVMQLAPCVLCWYQRIMMYPLVMILAVGMFLRDAKVVYYALPFSILGFIIALYHNILYYQMIPDTATLCVAGVSCTTRYIEWFGFVTIPLLSLIAFGVINGALVIYHRGRNMV